MAVFDFELPILDTYRPDVAEPSDFDSFWSDTLASARAMAAPPSVTSQVGAVSEFEVFDLRFSGFGGDEIAGWVIVPDNPKAVVVEFNGYGGGRGLPHERLWWPAAGYAWVFMDTRGQGSAWGSGGVTPDPHGSAPQVAGFMTRGIESPESYYFRRVFTDAVLLTDAVSDLNLGSGPLIVTGGSQGGGIALAVAGLTDRVDAVISDVPFLCHFERAVRLTDSYPYREIADFVSVHRETEASVFHSLSYVDGVNFAKRATAPALFSTALMDQVCPPSTVFAAKNHYGGNAEMVVYPFNGHEGGGGHHFVKQLEWLSGRL
jgi:cephalosporin-C deacetylase